MIIRATDTNRDWLFGNGLQDYRRDSDGLGQSIGSRLRSWKTNCFFAPDEGVDWNNFLDIGTKVFLDQDIQRVILQTGGVVRIRTYESTLDRDTRELSVETTIDTIYGELSVSEVI